MDEANILVPYLLRFEERPGYLFVRVEGEHDGVNLSLQYWDQILRLCRKLEYRKVLVVERLRRNISTEDAFKFACYFEYEAFEGIRIAFIDLLPKHSEINDYTARMSKRHGLDVEVFDEIPTATEWLLAA